MQSTRVWECWYVRYCDSKISSDALWTPHVQSASHRKNAMQNKLLQQHKAKRALDLESGTGHDEREDSRVEEDQPSAKRLRAEERKEEGRDGEEEQEEQQDTRLPSGFFDKTQQQEGAPAAVMETTAVDEEEWAAFQADIAQSTREKDQKQAEEDEEAARDIVSEEFDQVERLQQRVAALKSKREALRHNGNTKASTKTVVAMNEDGDDEEDSDADDLTWHKKIHGQNSKV